MRPAVDAQRKRARLRAMSLATIFAANLQSLRHQKRLTQQAFADKAGISVAYVSMLERGERTPPLETVELLARAFRVPAISMLQKAGGKR